MTMYPCHSEERTTKNLKSLCTHQFVTKWTVSKAKLRFLTPFGMTVGERSE